MDGASVEAMGSEATVSGPQRKTPIFTIAEASRVAALTSLTNSVDPVSPGELKALIEEGRRQTEVREKREKRKLEQEQEIRRKEAELRLLLGASPTSRLLLHQITLAHERRHSDPVSPSGR